MEGEVNHVHGLAGWAETDCEVCEAIADAWVKIMLTAKGDGLAAAHTSAANPCHIPLPDGAGVLIREEYARPALGVPPLCDLCGQPMCYQDEDADGPTSQWVCFCNGGNYKSAAVWECGIMVVIG